MKSGNISKNKKAKEIKPKFDLKNKLKTGYFLERIFSYISRKKALKIMKISKYVQKFSNISINDYKEYSQLYSSIEIELTITENKVRNIKPDLKPYIRIVQNDKKPKVELRKFINIPDEDKKYYHIYFDNSKEEIKRNHLKINEQVKMIRIKISYPVTSLHFLFFECNCINSINFKTFYGKNITDMSFMFKGCSSLKQLNFSNFNTYNVINMEGMFNRCSDELRMKIKSEYKNIKEEAFYSSK